MSMPISLPSDLIEAIIEGARRGHEVAARSHIEEEGWDSSTFGFNRYRLSWHWIATNLDEVDGVQVIDRTSCLRARWKNLEFGFYNGGIGEKWDPHTFDFEATTRRSEIGFSNMSPLPGLDPQPADLQHLLVVYSATPERGCASIYIGAPITSPTTGTTSWSWIEELWGSAAVEGAVASSDGLDRPGFREIEVDELHVDMKEEERKPRPAAETGTYQ